MTPEELNRRMQEVEDMLTGSERRLDWFEQEEAREPHEWELVEGDQIRSGSCCPLTVASGMPARLAPVYAFMAGLDRRDRGTVGGGQVIQFFVPGTPKPAGSKRGFIVRRKSGKQGVAIVDDCKKSRDWKTDVSMFAQQAYGGKPLTGALKLDVCFNMPRPKGHYRTGKRATELKPNAPLWHTSKPDATKLLRAVEDALTGIVWRDDAQVAVQIVTKLYSLTPGAHITIETLEATP